MAKTYTLANAPALDATGQQIKTALIAKTALLKRVGAKIKQDSDIALAAFVQKSASGSIASFPDGADGVPVKSLSADVNLVQEGSGDPSPENIRPIYGHTGVTVYRTGINLWDKTKIEDKYINDVTGDVGGNANSKNTGYVSIVAGETYYVRTDATSGRWGAWYDVDKNFVSGFTLPGTALLTAPANAAYLRVTVVYNNNNGNPDTFGINYPATETAYHAYEGDTYTVDFGQTVYGGTLDFITGVLTATWGIVDLGTLAWNRATSYAHPVLYANVNGIKGGSKIVADRFTYIGTFSAAASFSSSASNGDVGSNLTNQQIYIREDAYTDAASFKAAMSGAQLAYELAAPQTIQLTSHQITTLYGKNNVWADTGDVDLVYRAAPADIPLPPTEDGVYILKATVADGVPAIEWASNE